MKRSGPPKRKTPLAQGSKGLKRSALGRGDKALERSAQLRTYSPLKAGSGKRKRSPAETEAMGRWFAAVALGRSCCVPGGGHVGRVQGHHVIRQSVLEAIAEQLGWPYERVVWDVRFGIAVCEGHHDEHTRRHRRVSGTLVAADAWVAAEELDDALEAAGRPRTAILELRREHPC